MKNATKQPASQLLTIRKYGDPVLRKPAARVADINAELQTTIRNMFHTMYAEPGIGLAAPQVGLSLRLMVVDVSPDGLSRPLVLINPSVAEARGRVQSDEGCLSFPGIMVTIPRREWVKLKALNEHGLPVEVSGDGLLSRCLQHELDHLDGITMIDHLPLAKRLRVLWTIRKRKKAGLW